MYKYSGILVYARHPKTNKVYFLLAKNKYRKTWNEFSGHREKKDNNNPMITAAREFSEESNAWGYGKGTSTHSNTKIYHIALSRLKYSKKCIIGDFVGFLLDLSPLDENVIKRFNSSNEIDENHKDYDKHVEHTEIKWISQNELLNVVYNWYNGIPEKNIESKTDTSRIIPSVNGLLNRGLASMIKKYIKLNYLPIH